MENYTLEHKITLTAYGFSIKSNFFLLGRRHMPIKLRRMNTPKMKILSFFS
jgi:hypothetical protein